MKDEQIIEVEYNKDMVEEDKKATLENNTVLLEQDTFNTDKAEDLIGEGGTIDEYTEIN